MGKYPVFDSMRILSLFRFVQGNWGGAGIRKAPSKPERIKVIPGVDPTTRADHGKKNIIISEKRDKKVAKYLVKDLPYPYTSKAQFERAMENPLGVEWNTRVGFQRGTLPRVVKKVCSMCVSLYRCLLLPSAWCHY
jgi:U3 small nucleolar RNA-associated protein 14